MADVNFGGEALQTAMPLFREFEKALPSLTGMKQTHRSNMGQMLRSLLAQDAESRGRLGFNTVGGAFGGGTRRLQLNKQLMELFRKMDFDRSGELGKGFLGTLSSAPVQAQMQDALRRAAQPSTLGRIAGTLGGGALSLFGPGLASKVVGNPLMDLIKNMQGGGSGGGSQMDPQMMQMLMSMAKASN